MRRFESRCRVQHARGRRYVAVAAVGWIVAFCLFHFELRASEQGAVYGLGRAAADADIRKYDVFIPPSGANLPPGSGTAEKGKAIYAAQCARCHGATGREGPEEPLVGGIGSLTTAKPQKTVGSYWPYATTVFDYIRRAMPYVTPHSLTADETYAVTAYLLALNGVIAENDVMNVTTLPKVVMPNRANFDSAYREPRRR